MEAVATVTATHVTQSDGFRKGQRLCTQKSDWQTEQKASNTVFFSLATGLSPRGRKKQHSVTSSRGVLQQNCLRGEHLAQRSHKVFVCDSETRLGCSCDPNLFACNQAEACSSSPGVQHNVIDGGMW